MNLVTELEMHALIIGFIIMLSERGGGSEEPKGERK